MRAHDAENAMVRAGSLTGGVVPSVACQASIRRWVFVMLIGLMAGVIDQAAQADSSGHYVAGVYNIRDWVVPPEGFAYAQYNLWYHSDTFHDKHGDRVDSVKKGPLEIEFEPEVDAISIVPTFIWSTGWKVPFLG